MANPTTLQQRQQEMHRPFQPLDTTEGRQGRAIAAPQAQYAGKWNVGENFVRGATSLFSAFSRGSSKKEEIDPHLANIFAEAQMGLERSQLYRTPEDNEEIAKQAAIAGQSPQQYERQLALVQAYDIAAEEGWQPWAMQQAAKEYFGPDIQGRIDYEKRQDEFNKQIMDEALKNHPEYVVRDSNGEVNEPATLMKLNNSLKIYGSLYDTMNPHDSVLESIDPELNINMINSWPKQNQETWANSRLSAYTDLYTQPYIEQINEIYKQYNQGSGSIEEVRNLQQALTQNYQKTIRDIDNSYMPNIMKDKLRSIVEKDYSTTNDFFKERLGTSDATVVDNLVKKEGALISLKAFGDKGLVGDMERREHTAYGRALNRAAAEFMILAFDGDVQQFLAASGVSKEALANANAFSALDPESSDRIRNYFTNIGQIMTGEAPTSGSPEEIQRSNAIVRTQIKKRTLLESGNQGDEESINLSKSTLNQILSIDRGNPYNYNVVQTTADFVYDLAELPYNFNDKDWVSVNLVAPKYLHDAVHYIASSSLTYVTPTDQALIVYDPKTQSFVSKASENLLGEAASGAKTGGIGGALAGAGVGLLVGGPAGAAVGALKGGLVGATGGAAAQTVFESDTTVFNLNSAATNLTRVLRARQNIIARNTGTAPDDYESMALARTIVNQALEIPNVDRNLIQVPDKLNETSSEVKKITPSTYTGNIDLTSRPIVRNPDNSISTERSITIEEDGKYINIPTIVKGRLASDEEAIDYYHKTKAHLGIFDTLEEATKNAEEVHKMQEKRYSK